MNINGISVSDNSAPWKKRKTQRSITGTDFANRMADINRSNTVRQASDRTNGRKVISEAISRRDIYVNDTSGICSAGLYSKGNTSAAPEWNLPIETDRYRIEDASFLEGAAAYSITDKETGRSLYMREDQLVIQRDEKTGLSAQVVPWQDLYALLEISGNLKREKDGMTYLTPDGISYVPYDERNKNKAWHIILSDSDYSAARQYLAAGVDASNCKAWLNQFPGARLWDTDVKPSEHTNERPLLLDNDAPANEQDSNTHNEIIVRPDGSRVLVITMDIAGTQTAMSLQISEPTDLQNDVSGREDGSNEIDNEPLLTSDEISGSFSER